MTRAPLGLDATFRRREVPAGKFGHSWKHTEQTLTVKQRGAVRLRQVEAVLPLQVAAEAARRLRGLEVST